MEEGVSVAFPVGPVADRLSIWPMEDGRYGLDATFTGASGHERAEAHRDALQGAGIAHSFRQELAGAWTIRFGPLGPEEVGLALNAFIS